MSIRPSLLVAIAGTAVGQLALADKPDCPFGICMGTPIEALTTLEQSQEDKEISTYPLKTVPRPHEEFETYAVTASKLTGVCIVQAVSGRASDADAEESFNDLLPWINQQVGLFEPGGVPEAILDNSSPSWFSQWYFPEGQILQMIELIKHSEADQPQALVQIAFMFSNSDECLMQTPAFANMPPLDLPIQ